MGTSKLLLQANVMAVTFHESNANLV